MKRILPILIALVLLLPVMASADDGSYFEYEQVIKTSVDVKTPTVAIGDTLEFTVTLENTTGVTMEVMLSLGSERIWLDLGRSATLRPGERAIVDISMPMLQPNKWYKEGDKYYMPIDIFVNYMSTDYNSIEYYNAYYEDQAMGRVEITDLFDGIGMVRMDILDEDTVCGYTLDKYGNSYQPTPHQATVAVTNISEKDIDYTICDWYDEPETWEHVILKPGQSYIFESYSEKIYPKKNDKRNSVKVDYPFIFQIDGKYYAYSESRIYPTLHWDYGLDLKAKITRFEGDYKSEKKGYENYSLTMTNTGTDTIEGFYVAIGDAHLYAFNLANLTGSLAPGKSEQFYFVHPSNEPELNIYSGIVFNNSVYYTNIMTCSNMDTTADEIAYDYWYNEYCPDIVLTVTGDSPHPREGVYRPQDLTSTEAYSGPESLLEDTGTAPRASVKPTPNVEKPQPTATPTVVVRVEKQSMIPVWVWVVLPLSVALALGLVVVFRKELKEKINRKPDKDGSHIENK